MPDFADRAEKAPQGKTTLRNLLLTSRNSMSESELRAAAVSVQRVLLDLLSSSTTAPGLPSPDPLSPSATSPGPLSPSAIAPGAAVLTGPITTVAAYAPMGAEPGGVDLPRVLASALATDRRRLLLPVLLADGDLDWAAFTGDLVPGRKGLREPVGPRLGPTAIRTASIVVVPALAVDRTGMRLGRGGGSYDRVLTRLATEPRPFTVALLHEGELLDHVPADPHDRAVDAVITPSGGFTLRPTPSGRNDL
jgi:5-formyltetrahydrofolate cyclo-ligase